MIVFIIATQHVTKKSPEIIKKELLSSFLENLDENESGLIKAVRYANQPNKAI